VPFVGNPLVFIFGTTLYLLSLAGARPVISTVCSTSSRLSHNFICSTRFSSCRVSAFRFRACRTCWQWFTYANRSYYLIVIRGTFLRGSAFAFCGGLLGMAALPHPAGVSTSGSEIAGIAPPVMAARIGASDRKAACDISMNDERKYAGSNWCNR